MRLVSRPWMVPKKQRVIDILAEFDDIGVVTITENGVGHAYFCMSDIDSIPCEELESIAINWFIVKKDYGYVVEIEI